jgi:hypothetical protein
MLRPALAADSSFRLDLLAMSVRDAVELMGGMEDDTESALSAAEAAGADVGSLSCSHLATLAEAVASLALAETLQASRQICRPVIGAR